MEKKYILSQVADSRGEPTALYVLSVEVDKKEKGKDVREIIMVSHTGLSLEDLAMNLARYSLRNSQTSGNYKFTTIPAPFTSFPDNLVKDEGGQLQVSLKDMIIFKEKYNEQIRILSDNYSSQT